MDGVFRLGVFAQGDIPLALEVRPVLDAVNGHDFVKSIQQQAILVEQFLELSCLESTHPRLQHQLGIVADDVQRVELNAADPGEVIQNAGFTAGCARRSQPLMGEDETPGLSDGDLKFFHVRLQPPKK
jgi:hypothetical protein